MPTDGQNASLAKAIERNIAFWDGANKEPLTAKIPFTGFRSKPYPVLGGRELVSPQRVFPNDIDAERLVGYHETLPKPCNGDMIQGAACLYPTAWMEAIVGCPIYASAYSCSAKSVHGDIESVIDHFDIDRALKSEWFSVIKHVIDKLLEKAGNDMPVGHLHYRGIIDMIAAYMGEETLCLLMYDCPEKLERLANLFTELFLATVEADYEQRRTWKGGYVSTWGVFAPGVLLDYQIDASNLFSLDAYRKYFLKYDSQIIGKFPYSVMHLHACGLHILDAVLEIENLKAVEITIEKETGVYVKEKIFDACIKIQARSKSVLINGELSDAELVEYQDLLRPAGLALFYWNPIH